MRIAIGVILSLAVMAAFPPAARAWGASGHRIINGDAVRALPADVPGFVRTPEAIAEITALGPEADRRKEAPGSFDADHEPDHYLDLDDDGTIDGAVRLDALPPTREAYDSALRTGAPILGHTADQYVAGVLPYSILDGWDVVVEDFAIWRADAYGEAHAATPEARAAFKADRRLREALTVRDIGFWGHFVGDGSQPLHVSVHYNGWGPYPNPNNYTQSTTIHADFETKFVNAHATAALVQPRIAPYVAASQPFPARVSAYLLATNAGVPTVYALTGAGAFDAATPQALNFTLDRLAAGAQMLRDGIVDAWTASEDAVVSYPKIRVRDIESGAVPPPSPVIAN